MDSYRELSQLSLFGSNHSDLINRLIPEYNRLIAKYDSLRNGLLRSSRLIIINLIGSSF